MPLSLHLKVVLILCYKSVKNNSLLLCKLELAVAEQTGLVPLPPALLVEQMSEELFYFLESGPQVGSDDVLNPFDLRE